jgi:hypothetical protein
LTRVADANDPALIPVPSLQEFFRRSVGDAATANNVGLENHTEHYVVNLLTLFARADAIGDGPGSLARPLALLLADAADAPTGETRNALLRRLGDIALFVAGFMAEGLDRKAVGVGYYVRMGRGAYRSLSTSLPDNPRGRAFAPVFAELSTKFADVVDVLAEVRQTANGRCHSDVLRLYEQWLTTGSRRAERLLRQLGLEPTRQDGSVRQH